MRKGTDLLGLELRATKGDHAARAGSDARGQRRLRLGIARAMQVVHDEMLTQPLGEKGCQRGHGNEFRLTHDFLLRQRAPRATPR